MRVWHSRKFLVIGILVFALTLAVQGASQQNTAAVQDVQISGSADTVEARITASTTMGKFTYFELEAPHRLVVDFHDLQNGIGFKEKVVDRGGVEKVRASYFTSPERKATRIVFDLEGDVNYKVVDDGGGVVRVMFGTPAGTQSAARSAEPLTLVAGPVFIPQTAPVSPLLIFDQVPSLELTDPIIQLPPPPSPVAATPAPEQSPVGATPVPEQGPVATTPAPEQGPVATTPVPEQGPVATTPAPEQAPVATAPAPELGPVATTPAPEASPVAVTPAPEASPVAAMPAPVPSPVAAPPAPEPRPVTAPALRQIAQAPPPTAPVLVSPAKPQVFNGELISLDLKDVDIKDFFRLIADISGLNVFPDPNVSGSVTLVLRDVPWDQVLDAVLRNNNLTGTLQGNVLRISTNTTLQQEDAQRKAALEAQQSLVPLVSRTYILSYVKAAEVASMMKTPGAGILSPRGSVVSEPRRNAILVQDVAEQFVTIEQMKAFIDVPSQQVEIEARLLSATRSFSREIGTQLGLLVGANTGNILTGGSGVGSPFDRTPSPRAVAGTGTGLPLVTNFPAAATSGLAFLMQPGSDILLDAIITAAEAKGTAKFISRPKVTTQNNQEAVVSQGFQIPVQTNVNNTITVTYLQFALELSVLPQITEAGTILLTARIENSEPDFARAINGTPAVRTQQAQTQVLIPDGATAMIGGILVDQDTVNVEQVPGIGSIPIIGHLFKKTETVKSTAELLFFITPRIKAAQPIVPAPPGD